MEQFHNFAKQQLASSNEELQEREIYDIMKNGVIIMQGLEAWEISALNFGERIVPRKERSTPRKPNYGEWTII